MPSVNDVARTIVLFGLGKIPEVGGLISGLVAVFWPATGVDIWGEIKDQVQALIGQDIDASVYQQVQDDLQGLNNVLADYTQALQGSQGDKTYISEKYNVALGAFEAAQPHFMSQGYEVRLLPLMAPMANMHLSLLRDGALFGASWGWTPDIVKDCQSKVTAAVKTYCDWVAEWFSKGVYALQAPPDEGRGFEPWRSLNVFVRQMTLGALDFQHFWPYFDPATNPGGDPSKIRNPTRIIYADPVGSFYQSVDNDQTVPGDMAITISPPVNAPISGMNIWAWNYLDAVQVAHGGVWGPRLGDQVAVIDGHTMGGSNVPPNGWSSSTITTENPIVRVTGRGTYVVESLQLWFKDGTSTNVCGGLGPIGEGPYGIDCSYEGHVLSSIDAFGDSGAYGCANCAVFGFRYPDSYPGAPLPAEPTSLATTA